MQTQWSVLGYRIDQYFHDYKLAIEVDEYSHKNRDIDYEIKRRKATEKDLGFEFIRINPNKHDFNIFKAASEIHKHIKKSSNRALIDKISKVCCQENTVVIIRLCVLTF